MTNETRQALAARALAVQNHPANDMIDIVTFVHLAQTEEQAEKHVAYYEARAAVKS